MNKFSTYKHQLVAITSAEFFIIVFLEILIVKVFTLASPFFYVFSFLVLTGSFLGFYIYLYYVSLPIDQIIKNIEILKSGRFPFYTHKAKTAKDLGYMEESFSHVLNGLRKKMEFAEKIGKGDFNAPFEPESNDDMLGIALLNMREYLKEAEKKDKERNEITRIIAEVGNILRSNQDLDSLGDALIPYLCDNLKAVQGAFYVIEEDENKERTIQLSNVYAYNRKKHFSKKIKPGEGLVGQAVIEKNEVFLREIPDNYVSVKSGILGDKKPGSILIMPLIANEEVHGVIELASIYDMDGFERNVMDELSEVIGQTIFNVKVNEKTRKLLEESQEMSSELKEQSEQLQQYAEQMEITQEELQRSNSELEKQVKEVQNYQKKIHVLLENSTEIITTCDENGVLKYVSPSVTRIVGYTPDELINTCEYDRIDDQQGDAKYEQMIKSVLNNPEQTITDQYLYQAKNGKMIWMEATAKNLLHEEAVQGIVVNASDITERKRAEKESRMRSQMQSLSENSPDLICRFNTNRKFFYVNPSIKRLTGLSPDNFIERQLNETSIADEVKQQWEELIENVLDKNENILKEMNFPALDGEKVMSVNAIPEKGEDQNIESVLLVSNDITERKAAELEIKNKNKKINESINYAQRIQEAILPDNQFIKEIFPDSFMYYKPRDVVSGDFPWFLNDGNDYYIAVIDCTGHGVPGALLSLIGYFLLNDIVKGRNIKKPGEIMDALNEGVTQTLKQDNAGSDSKDGMDISFCRINFEEKKLEYAGAHRPLYYISNNELYEYKGDKFAIGGGLSRNQTHFATQSISFKEGDGIFFFSDGFPDQFGGEKNRKFSPKKIRNLIVDNYDKSDMQELRDKFDEAFIDWKGNNKQTDDVLMIGIRF